MGDPTISAVVLVKNHERHIGPCLRTLDWVDEVVLVNDHSTDRTLEVARQFPHVRMLDRLLNGNWSAQMNFGIQAARGDWILQIDVDERVPAALAREMMDLAKREDIAGVAVRILGTFVGKRWGDEPDSAYAVRMVRRGRGLFDDRYVHAQIQVDGEVARAREVLVHLGPFPTAKSFWLKNALYAEIEAAYNAKFRPEMIRDSFLSSLITFLVKPAGVFFQKYFLQGGWKKGIYGLHYAIMRAIGYYMVYVATWEKIRGELDEVREYCEQHGIPYLDDPDPSENPRMRRPENQPL